MGKTFRPFDEGWREEILTCPECGWQGTFDEGVVEIHEGLVDSSCPECNWLDAPILAKLLNMTLRDTAENPDKLSGYERQFMVGQQRSLARDPETKLRYWYELPEIDNQEITIMWHGLREDGEQRTLLLYNDDEIWREKAVYGGSERFSVVAAILKYRYGDRLADLVPTVGSVEYLLGEDSEVLARIYIDLVRSSIKVGHKRYLAEIEKLSGQKLEG